MTPTFGRRVASRTKPAAGAITAGYFLKHFAPAKARWAHLDIAGTAWGDNAHRGYLGKGASGFGVRLVVEWLRRRVAKD